MSGVQHLSMRVPWRDRLWDEFLCDDPLGNSSCTLLANIGPKRDDAYEIANASAGIDTVDQDRIPCLSERGTFMSRLGYTVTKKHPYARNPALKDHLLPSVVQLPGYAFEAVPFRWLSRATLAEDVGLARVPAYNPTAEDHIDALINYAPAWVMDGNNQRAVLDAFFEPVVRGHSLVFIYLKHSPLQEQRTDRLLVGAARISDFRPPPMWNQSGRPPFTSCMWETIVEHTLRPDMRDGILLPYQRLLQLLDQGVDVGNALAWAPEGRDVEFSYVTEHLSDDAALQGLAVLERAAHGMQALGIDMPDSALDWITGQNERLWQARGPVPGLAAVLATLGVPQPYPAARAILEHARTDDPWPDLEELFGDASAVPAALKPLLPSVTGRVWAKLPATHQTLLRMLSSFDVSPGQVEMLTSGSTEVEVTVEELLANPYFAVTCTYGQPEHVPFTTVDRALYPSTHVTWSAPVPDDLELDGPHDPRRIEALLADVLERQGLSGDTLTPLDEALELANAVNLSQPPSLNRTIITGLDLDHDSLLASGKWSPLTSVTLADGSPAYKLSRYENTSAIIRDWIESQLARQRFGELTAARTVLDESLERNRHVTTATSPGTDELEDTARTEKGAGLSVLHDSPLSVLIGPAGTGKTTLLRALVDYPGVANGGVLLLAPTGKARVQLETKVERQAFTLASYLTPSGRYDADTGRYLVWGDAKPRRSYGLVVIDEASMLTEEMLAATVDAFTGVTRLILVGDPRQLPPIGPGRPFVDLVGKLRPASFADWIRVGPGYVELQVPRRQLPDGSQGTRHDLALAAWFGDDSRGAADDQIWADLAADPDQLTVRYEPWGERSAVQALTAAMCDELGLAATGDQARAFALTYGGAISGEYLNWELGAGERAENWQILSPTRSRAFGTVELNRHIKRTYRVSDTRFAQQTRRANIPDPIGPELIVRGDKVMQTVNRRHKAYPASGGMNYVANGEIGVAIGRIVPQHTRQKKALMLNVEFSSQPGFQYTYWPTDSDDVQLELAWAVTVHKSQGSEFETTFLVLPARSNVSRELLYTALTRQKKRVVIVHEGTLEELRDLSAPWRSETARRLTDLFTAPEPVSIEIRGRSRRYDRNLMHVAANGTPMASKNEVIIADVLDRLVPGQWRYEEPLVGRDGREVLPDFTIITSDGRKVLWEHAGMLDRADYARKWKLKQAWYAENGILPHAEGGGPNGVLLWTDDRAGADAQAWLMLAAAVLGVDASTRAVGGGSPSGARRAAKKAPPRRSTR